jgi:hypothetical protein
MLTSLFLALTQLAVAQQPALRGTILAAESGDPLGFSIVSLHPGRGQQFTDAAGTFTFEIAKAGNYLLSVRQIGYAPFDTQLVIGDRATSVHITLRHLAIELPPVTISATECTNPGPPDSSDATLRAVFDQLQENARRFELLADSYPFRYTLELADRELNQRGDTGPPVVKKLYFSSSDNRHHPYAVGRVVERGWGPWGSDGVMVIRSAELDDLGNPDFIASHCFHLAGRDTIGGGGETLVRIDFEPAVRIQSADMAGAAYLDSSTYELRYTTTRITKPERSALMDVRTVTFRTRFRNITRGVPLQDWLTAVTTYQFGRRTNIQTQRTAEVRFRRQPPLPVP